MILGKKYLLTVLLFFLFTFAITAQSISVKSFRSTPDDMTARITEPVIDQNGDKCALIKVRTSQKGFVFEGDMLGVISTEQRVGELWVYVPKKAKKITIMHQQLGVLDKYIYPEKIEEASVYIMELIANKTIAPTKEKKAIPIQRISENTVAEKMLPGKTILLDHTEVLKERTQFFLTTNSSIFAPYGIRMGLLARTSFYIAANFSEKPGDLGSMTKSKFEYTLEEDASTLSDFDDSDGLYYKSTDEKAQVFNYAISIGLTSDLGNNWFMYYGLGYGVHHKLYNFESYYSDTTFRANILVKDDESSVEGAVFEAGFIVKVKPFALTAGWSTINFDRHEVKLGIGFYF